MTKDCVSLEVARKLQAVGYKGECEKSYYLPGKNWMTDTLLANSNLYTENFSDDFYNEKLAAPTATQLAEEMPYKLKVPGIVKPGTFEAHTFYPIITHHTKGKFTVTYRCRTNISSWMFTEGVEMMNELKKGWDAENLPDALGLMMVYLLENKLV